ncbi:MAG TPA: hypothetical protein VGC74_10225 [Stenotrophomonas sp.]|jgi:hypothetical protein
MNMLRVGFLVVVALLISACADPSPYPAGGLLDKENVECVPPARLEIQPWGKSGSSKSCKITDGPFVAAENGYIHLRGQYEAGREVGIWRWYDKGGSVTKTIDYSKSAPAH